MSLEVGQRLSHYRLEEKIGEGGMGVVWRATDDRLHRSVALKLLPGDVEDDPDRLARFEAEARTAAALNHPNVVTVFAVEEADGRRFLVMELVRGATLARLIPRDGMPLGRFLELAVPLAEGVEAAHRAGITHRDLKPRNVMISREGRLKILDFGVAKELPKTEGVEITQVPTLTLRDHHIEGSIPYMAPEQLTGQPVDRRSDIFALGVILYEMATGERPFRGATAAELIASILRDEPRPVTDVRPMLPRALACVVARAMRKNPADRFQDVAALRDRLEELRTEVAAGRAPADTHGADAEMRSIAVLPLEDLTGDPEQAFFADGMTDALINSLARIGALKVISRTSVMRYRGARKSLAETAAELGVELVVEGSVLRAGDRVRITAQLIDAPRDRLMWAESYEEGMVDVLELQRRVARLIAERVEVKLTPQERAQLTRADRVDPSAHEAYLKGRHFWYGRTTDSVRRGLKCFEQAVRDDPGYAPAYAGIADSYIVDGGRYLGVSPDVAYTKARAAATKALELDEHLAEAHTSLAAVMTDYDWDWPGADREYRRAIELNPNYATAHSWYAEQLSRMGRHDEAVREARIARDLDPLSLSSGMILAWILFFARRYDQAIEQARTTLDLDPDYATARRVLGWAYEETGRAEEAVTEHRRAVDLTDRSPNFTAQLVRAYAVAGRVDEARRELDALKQLSGDTYVSAMDIATVHAALGDTTDALDWLDRAFDERADHLPYLKVNPRLDALRGEPRFQRLLERMGLAADRPDRPRSA